MTNTATAKKELRPEGDLIAFRSGRVLITLQFTRPGVYTVAVAYGSTGIIFDQASYADQTTARGEARRITKAYAGGSTPDQLAEQHEALSILADEYGRKRFNTPAQRLAKRYAAQADAIQSLQGRAAVAQMIPGVVANIEYAGAAA